MSAPAPLRAKVWVTYIGLDVGQTDCPMCEITKISPFQFHCSHVISKAEGGECSLENLRPLCSICNESMGKRNMLDYAKQFFPTSPLIPKPVPMAIDQKPLTKANQPNLSLDVPKLNKPEVWYVAGDVIKCKCQHCQTPFTVVSSLNRHLKNGVCKKTKVSKTELMDQIAVLTANQDRIMKRLNKIEI